MRGGTHRAGHGVVDQMDGAFVLPELRPALRHQGETLGIHADLALQEQQGSPRLTLVAPLVERLRAAQLGQEGDVVPLSGHRRIVLQGSEDGEGALRVALGHEDPGAEQARLGKVRIPRRELRRPGVRLLHAPLLERNRREIVQHPNVVGIEGVGALQHGLRLLEIPCVHRRPRPMPEQLGLPAWVEGPLLVEGGELRLALSGLFLSAHLRENSNQRLEGGNLYLGVAEQREEPGLRPSELALLLIDLGEDQLGMGSLGTRDRLDLDENFPRPFPIPFGAGSLRPLHPIPEARAAQRASPHLRLVGSAAPDALEDPYGVREPPLFEGL